MIDVATLIRQLARDCDVLIPAAVEKLHKTHIALEQPPCEQAIRRVAAGPPDFRTVSFESRG